MRNSGKPSIWFILLMVILAIAGPVAIHVAYKIPGPEWLSPEWSAGDAFSYYGTILASIITIVGLFYTFKDNRQGIQEQSRLDKLPYIGVTTLDVSYHLPLLDIDSETRIDSQAFDRQDCRYHYTEKKLERLFCIIGENDTKVQKRLTDQQKRMILQQGVTQERIADGVYSAVNHAFLYWPLEITNIGNGPAIDFRFGFNNHNGYNKDTARFVPPMPLKLEDSLYVAILAEDIKEKHCGTYLIEFYYKDVFGNNYRQEHKLTIKKNDKGNIQAQLDCGLQQKKILPDDLPRQFL